jgi:hypothetical protein
LCANLPSIGLPLFTATMSPADMSLVATAAVEALHGSYRRFVVSTASVRLTPRERARDRLLRTRRTCICDLT